MDYTDIREGATLTVEYSSADIYGDELAGKRVIVKIKPSKHCDWVSLVDILKAVEMLDKKEGYSPQ